MKLTTLLILLSMIMLTACKSDKPTKTASDHVEKAVLIDDIEVNSDGRNIQEELDINEISDEAVPTPELASAADNATKANNSAKSLETKVKEISTIKVKQSSNKASTTVKKVEKVVVKPTTKPTIPAVQKDKVSKPVITKPNPPNGSGPNPPNKDELKEELPTKPSTKPQKPPRTDVLIVSPSHQIFNTLLSTYVSADGTVDYSGLKSKAGLLDKYLELLEAAQVGTSWTRDQKLAFWINAYNAYTIKLILNNFPVAKITDLHNGKPWDQKWIKLNGQTLSLNNIENDIIRPEFREPRIHFAVNCAAKSCPPLLNAAFSPEMLSSQLESQTKKFINNPSYNSLSKNEITVSKIFDWYGADFGDIATYISKYATSTIKPSAEVKFMEYDWRLNGK